jgi:hypothetical protein
MSACKHGFDGVEELSHYTGALLGRMIIDECHVDMYGSQFCPTPDTY